MKVTRMLVVSLRGVNCRFWSHLGCTGQKADILTHIGIAFKRYTSDYERKLKIHDNASKT